METKSSDYKKRVEKWLNGPWWIQTHKTDNDGYCIGPPRNFEKVDKITVDEPTGLSELLFRKVEEHPGRAFPYNEMSSNEMYRTYYETMKTDLEKFGTK